MAASHIYCYSTSASLPTSFITTYEVNSVSVLSGVDGGSPIQYLCNGAHVQLGSSAHLTNTDFNELWPLIIGLFVTALIVKKLIGMFAQNAGRN